MFYMAGSIVAVVSELDFLNDLCLLGCDSERVVGVPVEESAITRIPIDHEACGGCESAPRPSRIHRGREQRDLAASMLSCNC